MKIVIERKSFVDALSIGSQMAGKSKGLSILSDVKVTIKDKTATISSYDTEVAITKRTTIVEHDEDIVFCIEPKALLANLNSLKDETLTFELNNYICEIIHSKGRISMPYEDAEDFPTPTFDKDTKSFEVESELLYNWLKEAKNFVGNNTLYPALMNVCLYWENGEFGVASTDQQVLYHDCIESEYDGDKETAVVCVKAVDSLLPMINKTDKVTIMNGSRNVVFRTNESMLVSTKTEQPYPNFKAIIAKNNPIEVIVEKDELLDSVKRAMLSADPKTCLLKLSIGINSIKMESNDWATNKKTIEECPCTRNGGDIVIGAKGNRVIDLLNSIEDEMVTLKFSEPHRPILFCDSLNNAKVLELMPMQLV